MELIMSHVIRPYAVAGAALVGAGLLAATPAIADRLTEPHVHDVALTAGSDGDPGAGGIDLAAGWTDAFDTASDNAQTAFDAADVAQDSLASGLASDGALDNLATAWQAASLIGVDDDLAQAVVPHTLGGSGTVYPDPDSLETPPDAGDSVHLELYEGLTGNDPDEYQPPDGDDSLADLVNVMASPLSGVFMGMAGPAASPAVALFNDLDEAAGDLSGDDADPQAALADLANTPANMVDAAFNGATLDLDFLVPTVQDALLAEDDTEDLEGLSLGFGGLFSPGEVYTGVGGEEDGVGGSLLNSIGFTIDFDEPLDEETGEGYIGIMDADAVGIGPVGAIAGLEDIVGQALGGDLLG